MIPERVHKLDAVFGISRELPETYVERDNIDDVLINSLARDKHIVIFGSSKQGKTCLRKHCLEEKDYIVASCQNNWTLTQLHSAILKAAGYSTQEARTRTADGRLKLDLVFTGNVGVPGVVQAGVRAGASGGHGVSQTEERRRLEIDPQDPNDIIAALREIDFKQFLVLEDFHYIPVEPQEAFSFVLKAFYEISDLVFIIVAVWREENRLIVFNGDLTGRVVAIDADAWSPNQLGEVIRHGEVLLNIEFAEQFKTQLIENSFESVYIVQETIADGIDPENLIRDVVNEQSGRYKSFLTNFAMGYQDTELQMFRWLLYPVLVADIDELQNGLRYSDIRKAIQASHPRGADLNLGNLTQALQSATQLQSKKNIKPFVLDYDRTNLVLSIVDKGFLIWLQNQNKKELLELLDLPSDG